MGTPRQGRGTPAATTLEEMGEAVSEAADAFLHEAEKIGAEVRAGLTALPDQLEDVRQTVLATVEPYRPPQQYRRYVQIGILVLIVAAVTAVIVRSRRSAGDAPDAPDASTDATPA